MYRGHNTVKSAALVARLPDNIVRAVVVATAALACASVRGQSPDSIPALEPIVVTATRHEERAFDVPASVDIITGAVIRDVLHRLCGHARLRSLRV